MQHPSVRVPASVNLLRAPWRISSLILLAGLVAVATWVTQPAFAQVCVRTPGCGFDSCKTPATPVPRQFWGELQPVDTAPYPDSRDMTFFNTQLTQFLTNPIYEAIDIQNGMAVTAMSVGVKVWNVSAGGSPVFEAYLPYTQFPAWSTNAEIKEPLTGVSLPSGNSSTGAVTGSGGVGTAILDFTTPTHPAVMYQDPRGSANASAVYAAKIGATNYAFAASVTAGVPSVYVYNMDAARANYAAAHNAPCNEARQSCPGVLAGAVGTRDALYVSGAGNYLAVTGGFGVDLWDVTNPASPVMKTTGLSTMSVYGTAMWSSAGHYYLAARTGTDFNGAGAYEMRIFDVSCITSGCGSFPASALATIVDTAETPSDYNYVTLSFSNGTPFLYLGSDTSCGLPTPQREWLFDVSNPAAPRDITPASTAAGGYWGWYYNANYQTGFNLVEPRQGKFWGSYFYRVAHTLFDVHQHVGSVAPSPAFTWTPSVIYPGTPVSFVDQSTGQPTSWSWTFSPDGTPSSSGQENPTASFATAGQKSVSLVATNATGHNLTSQNLSVLSPQPVVSSISLSPASPLQCQPVTLTANGVTGQPPLTWAWSITSGGNPAPGGTSSAAGSFLWDTQANSDVPGNYVASVGINNATNAPASAQVSFTLGTLPTLPASSTFAPTNDSFASATVQFHVNVPGATQWSWNFGDGAGFGAFTNDPVNGPNPIHTYASVNSYNVQVQVRNCVNLGGSTSSALAVNVTQITPLVASFAPQCLFGFCAFDVNSPITFTDNSQGATFWDYDWNGTGGGTSFPDAGHTSPVTSHTYTTAGTYHPTLRVRRGTDESNVFVYAAGLVVSANTAPPPAAEILVSGPTSGTPGTTYTFNAAALNCTPSATWSWSAAGGTISGSSTGSSITVSWATAGSFSVATANSGCSGAIGSSGITIGTGGGGGVGGALTAIFNFSPTAPAAGQAVSFNGTASTGGPSGYSWVFGDGTTGSGSTVNHTYAQAGTYTVKLDVEAPGSGAGCLLGTCVNEAIQQVVVSGASGGPPPPPLLSGAFTSPACTSDFGITSCNASAGVSVTLTASDTRGTTYAWNFGDGTTGSGTPVTHTWTGAQTYTVTLTVSGTGFTSGSSNAPFAITTPPPPTTQSVILPWVAETRGALVQSCDLYLHNPGAAPLTVSLEFLKRGTPGASAPQATATIQPGATMYAPDVVNSVFQQQNISGFVTVTVGGTDTLPIITSFNTVTRSDGSQFGQTVPGLSLAKATSANVGGSQPSIQNLIGLDDNTSELAYFGITNPTAETATYHVTLFDSNGSMIGESSTDLQVAPFGQRQFQQEDVHNLFGLTSATDYRIQIENISNGALFPYGENVRLGSTDPNFITVGSTTDATQYVVGAFSNTGTWQSDVVLANTTTQPMTVTMTFTSVGLLQSPTAPIALELQPGETQRLSNAIATEWQLNNVVGIITVQSTGASGAYPQVQAESYNIANPANRFGQSMRAFAESDAATTGQGSYLVGLRQDAGHLTTLWLFNPSATDTGVYDLVYRGLDGTILGTLKSVFIPPGKARQFLPAAHPIPAAGVTNGFTVQVLVHGGEALTAAQVLTLSTGDPAYIQGAVR
jgi:PKD repeat protein